ncbi:glucokinase [Thiococcus pfennigii]|uniref:glucokinase n=1 Tax=Thiococcus pfennigii TaxID=1057 RepID=UPI0030B91065
MMRILAGDIGGTKTALALAELDGPDIRLGEIRRYPSREHDTFESVVRRFQAETRGTCTQAAFAVAGPVIGDRSQTTNLPWALDARALERDLGLERVRLLNDLEAIAWGLPALGEADLATLHPGEPGAHGNACIIAAGTGLGQAGLYWDGRRHWPFATEGGHGDFAPSDARELALLDHLRDRFGHVSWERVVSGPGIADIYRFVAAEQEAPAWLREELARRDVAEVVAEAAAQRRCPHCVETMTLFLRLYGREAGNLALKQMALGGVYLGGGIAPKNLAALRSGPFLEAFFDKGRMAPLMRRMPVRVILSGEAPLFGAARYLAHA